MEGFEIPIFISLIVAVFLVLILMLLERNKYGKYISRVIIGLLLFSIGTIVVSLFIGGWTGMGYGIMGLFILIGTILGSVIFGLTKWLLKRGH
ncbi:YesK family protein [Solibacillus sp. FSL H8-0538]|uniref:YesK family protein n=1 Tax=Solibacillus sp. FSL H8-0538 TaxID=2921400 RepID=UPI0030F8D2B7